MAKAKAKFILDDLTKILNHIEQSKMGAQWGRIQQPVPEDLDLTSSKLGKSESAKNELIVKIINQLNEVGFWSAQHRARCAGRCLRIPYGKFASGAGKRPESFTRLSK